VKSLKSPSFSLPPTEEPFLLERDEEVPRTAAVALLLALRPAALRPLVLLFDAALFAEDPLVDPAPEPDLDWVLLPPRPLPDELLFDVDFAIFDLIIGMNYWSCGLSEN
jgi:hypothetical protein